MDANELKPCPMCGAAPKLIVGFSPLDHAFVDCECGMQTELKDKADEVVAMWNHRAALPSDAAQAPPTDDARNLVTLDRRDLWDSVRGAIHAALHDKIPKDCVVSWAWQEATNRTMDIFQKIVDAAPVAPQAAGDAAQEPSELHSAINEVADFLETSANLSIISQFTAITEWVDARKASTDADFFAGICVGLQVITAQDRGVAWREIVRACDVDKLLQYAAHIEPDEWELAGFAKYAHDELGKEKPAMLAAAPVAPAAAAPRCMCSGLGPCEQRTDGSCRLNAVAQPDKRAAFEAWAKPRGYDLTRCSPAPYAAYRSDFTNGALAGWFGAHEPLPTLSTETVDKPVQSMSDTARDRDAARYRWLRQHRLFPSTSTFTNAVELDIAIDAARKGAAA